jgi:A/G-specific adenine glycosylase
MDGNIERVIKRLLNLKSETEISKENLIKKKKILGTSDRPGDYAQALMELGALICKPKKPLCEKCPLTKKCKSYKKQDFEIAVKSKKKIDKFFIVKIFTKGTKILLIKNTKFNFLKNLKIFPMVEISKPKSLKKSLNFKMSNMNMNINIKAMKRTGNIANSSWIEQAKFNSYILPTFTKKIFSSLGKYL